MFHQTLNIDYKSGQNYDSDSDNSTKSSNSLSSKTTNSTNSANSTNSLNYSITSATNNYLPHTWDPQSSRTKQKKQPIF